MPFDVLPQETKVGLYQRFADALLRGCLVTYPIKEACLDGKGGACAIGAVFIGLGRTDALGLEWGLVDHTETQAMEDAYYIRYGCLLTSDNDNRGYTREQIAARIAAL